MVIQENQCMGLCTWPNAVCCVKHASLYHGSLLCVPCSGWYLADDKLCQALAYINGFQTVITQFNP
jgi:hypothetical protein